MLHLRDRRAADRATATLADEQIGQTRYRTPEGYLLCEGARIARTGPMLYAPDEMPDVEVGPYGRMITILRDADVLFAPDTIQSFIGKPITNDHPAMNVNPETFKEVTVGTVLNPRQGEGVEAQYLLADLLITDAAAIAAVEANKVQLSPGYDCEVEQLQPGLGRQTFVLGNHVALVDQGRGGPSCSIQDGESQMAKRKLSLADRLRAAFKAKDEAAFEQEIENAGDVMDEGEDGGDTEHRVVIEVKGPEAAAPAAQAADEGGDDDRLAKLETAVAAIAEQVAKLVNGEQAEAEANGTADEAAEEYEEVEKQVAMDAASKAEILVPGIRVPTFDSAKVKHGAVTSVRRNALSTAYADAGRRKVIDSVLGGRAADFGKMPARDVATVFDAAAAVVAAANNAGSRARAVDIPQGPMTAARYAQQIKDRRAKKA